MKKIAVTAGILAGGKSSRMGENKAFLSWQGTDFLRHAIALMGEFEQILISVAEKETYRDVLCSMTENEERQEERFSMAEKSSCALVEDEQKDYGPLEGIYQLLRHAEYEWVLIVATDMPLLNQDIINRLVGIDRKNVQAVVVKDSGHAHPLCGLYHVSVLPVLKELFAEDIHSMYQLLQRIQVKHVMPEEIGAKEQAFSNINTPGEYKRLRGGAYEGSDYNLQ